VHCRCPRTVRRHRSPSARRRWGKTGYLGPAPIRGHGPHRYIFQLFALDKTVDLARHRVDEKASLKAISGHVIARGQLTGTYEQA